MMIAWGLLIIRLIVGLTFVGHGAQKLFGWFGGPGIKGTARLVRVHQHQTGVADGRPGRIVRTGGRAAVCGRPFYAGRCGDVGRDDVGSHLDGSYEKRLLEHFGRHRVQPDPACGRGGRCVDRSGSISSVLMTLLEHPVFEGGNCRENSFVHACDAGKRQI